MQGQYLLLKHYTTSGISSSQGIRETWDFAGRFQRKLIFCIGITYHPSGMGRRKNNDFATDIASLWDASGVIVSGLIMLLVNFEKKWVF
jgi:hypothetical protein